MSKLKTLKESRAAVFAKIDELRTATDGLELRIGENPGVPQRKRRFLR